MAKTMMPPIKIKKASTPCFSASIVFKRSNVQKWCKQAPAFPDPVLVCGVCTNSSKHRA
jgi:hypothetical protein